MTESPGEVLHRLVVQWALEQDSNSIPDDIRARVAEHLTVERAEQTFGSYLDLHPDEAQAYRAGNLSIEAVMAPVFQEVIATTTALFEFSDRSGHERGMDDQA